MHSGACSNAAGRVCVCTVCAGAQHGWPGALILARPANSSARLRYRASATQLYSTAHRATQPRKQRKAAAAELVKADVIDWLADEALSPGDREVLTGKIAEIIGSHMADAVLPEQRVRPGSPAYELRLAMASHFCCEMLSQTACLMNNVADEMASLPHKIASAIGPPGSGTDG